ncbi:MAG TPA: hypothetical protein PL185_05180 [Flavobacteriales bacterium]|nr:hypothetical protein [Flavobacteriales bacterium]
MVKVAASLILGVCIALLLPSCSPKRAHAGSIILYNPVEYNDFIVDHQNATIRHMVKLTEAFDSGTEKEIQMQYAALVNRSDSSVAILKQLSDYEGDTLLRNAAINLLVFYNQVFHHEYKEMIDIFLKGDSATDAEITRLNTIVEKVRTQEDKLNQQLSVAQEEFAKKFQFEFEAQTP